VPCTLGMEKTSHQYGFINQGGMEKTIINMDSSTKGSKVDDDDMPNTLPTPMRGQRGQRGQANR